MIKSLKPFFLLFVAVYFKLNGFSQDLHFSQYLFNPMNLNPAQTGNFNGQLRFSGYHRNQWRAIGHPFITSGVGAEFNFFKKRNPFSLGILVLNDQSGQVPLSVNKFQLSMAYHPQLGKNMFHFGLQSGLIMKQIDLTNSTFASQYDRNTGGYNNQLPGAEFFGTEPIIYPDLNFGAGWQTKIGKFTPSFGVAVFHANKPTESFLGAQNKVNVRQVYDVRLGYKVSNFWHIEALFYETIQSKAQELLTGFLATINVVNTKTNITQLKGLGLMRTGFNRNGDSAIIGLGLRKNNVEGMLSYDITYSNLKLANDNRGGIEFSFIYTIPTKIQQSTIFPCERF